MNEYMKEKKMDKETYISFSKGSTIGDEHLPTQGILCTKKPIDLEELEADL